MQDEFDEIMSDMENRLNEAFGTKALPAAGFAGRMVPALRGEFRVDVREHENEVLVVADLPGVEKQDVSLRLVNPRTLELSWERKEEKQEKEEGWYLRERTYGSMSRIIALPKDVTEEGSEASFKNGVLEVRLKKLSIDRGARIQIE
ncbi:MAG: Hsp20/alpha crystallin family protein [Methanoregulaceae archaeon]|nr:Hsp20/alpha crystallin family protein [Methanoregulaceae archaeon]